jgi:ParB-like chromosome segregation protein Spo0J
MTTFKQMILAKEIKRADAMRVRYQDLYEEPGFNLRIEDADFQASIEALADHIEQGAQYPALEVRPRDLGGVFIVDGHRRKRAIGLAIERGAPLADRDGEVWVPIVAFEGNDADRVARVITSAAGRALSPIEVAHGYARLRAFGWDNTRIAQKVGKTPQHVAQLLILADANSDVQRAVGAGEVSAAEAVKLVRKHGDQAGTVLAGAAKNARGKVTAGTMQGKALPRKVVDELETSLKWFVGELTSDARVKITQAETNPAQYASAEVTISAGALAELVKAAALADGARKHQDERVRENAAKAAQTDIEDVK